jgi:exonuclease SbcD
MIRVAHFSDLHYGHKTLAEADRCFGAAIDQAVGAGVDAAVISGDSTDHALDMHSPAAQRLVAQVHRLAAHCPVLMLQGTFSHEPPGTLSVFRLLGTRYPIHVADSIEQVALSVDRQWLTAADRRFDRFMSSRPAALFSCVPTANKAAVAAALGAAAAAGETGGQLAAVLRGFARANRLARSAGVPTVGVSHGTVFGSISEHGVPMAGFDHEFTTGALFDAEAQAVMLGHLHRHQAWMRESAVGRQCIAYAGSIGRFHFGEEGAKGFLLWDVDADSARCRLVETPARRTVDLVFEGRPDMEALRAAVREQGLAGASVRVRWTVAEEDQSGIDHRAIREALVDAAELKLEGRVVPVTRTRAAGIAQLCDLNDKVRRWADLTEVRVDPLIACLARLRSLSPDDIAEQVLREVEMAPRGLGHAGAEAQMSE